jgi:UDP-N-acetylglucosamine 2-epimerase
LQDPEDYSKMQSLQNPYGDGQAAARVTDVVMKVTQG